LASILPYLLTIRIPYSSEKINKNFLRPSNPEGRIYIG